MQNYLASRNFLCRIKIQISSINLILLGNWKLAKRIKGHPPPHCNNDINSRLIIFGAPKTSQCHYVWQLSRSYHNGLDPWPSRLQNCDGQYSSTNTHISFIPRRPLFYVWQSVLGVSPKKFFVFFLSIFGESMIKLWRWGKSDQEISILKLLCFPEEN